MVSTITDRLYGESSGVAVKAPVVAVSPVGNVLPLTGLAPVGSYSPDEGDRILVWQQNDPTTNGIYNASVSAWQRSGDFDGAYDCVQGTLVVALIDGGSSAAFYQLTTLDPVIGTTPLNFSPLASNNPNITYPQTAAEIEADVTIVNGGFPVGYVDRYGTNAVPGTTDMRAAIKSAWQVCVAQGGGVITFLDGFTYALNSTDPATPVNLPAQQSNGTVINQAYIAQVYCFGGSDITFDFRGAKLVSTVTGLSVGSGVGILFDNCQRIRLISPNMTGTQVQTTGVVALGAVTGGAGYVNGTYTNVLMNGGTGNGCCCTVIVAGGAVTTVTPTYPGGGFVVGDVLSAPNASLGGSGAGFSVPVTNVTGAGNVVGVAAVVAFGVTSLSGPSNNITTHDLTTKNCYLGFWAVDNPNLGRVTSNISILGHTSVINGEYGFALHNSGDDTFIENLNTFAVNRPYFFYGCQNVVVAQLDAQATNYGFGAVIKAYNRPARNITVNQSFRNAPGNPTSRLSIQVQCDPALFPVAPTVKNIYITHDEQGLDAGSNSIEFDSFYSAGGAQAATCNQQLFDQIAIRGFGQGILFSTVKFTTAAAQCQINYDNFESSWSTVNSSGEDIRTGLGFIASREFFCQQSLQFGGTTVAGTAGFVQCFIADGFCKIQGTITLTAKNGAGQATVVLPFASRLDGTTNSMCVVAGVSGMSGLGSGSMFGMLPGNSNLMNLYYQTATAAQSVVDTNFTAASEIAFDITYPI